MSMAIKYAMKKRMMAKGGDVKGVHKPAYEGDKGKELGHSTTGNDVRSTRYSNRSPFDPKAANARAKEGHHKVLGEMREMRDTDRTNFAEGGEVDDDSDMIGRIMKKRCYSEGGQVANDDKVLADFLPNEFDDLALDDDLESSYTGENSGDEIGDEQEDMDRHDIVARIMRSRAKKDRLPRPA